MVSIIEHWSMEVRGVNAIVLSCIKVDSSACLSEHPDESGELIVYLHLGINISLEGRR